MNGRRRVSRTVLGIGALAAALTFPASAGFDDQPPPLASDTLPGDGAASYRFTVPDHADVWIFFDSEHHDASLIGEGIWFADGSGIKTGFVSSGFQDGQQELHLELPDPIGVVYDVQPVPPDESPTGIGLLLSNVPAGTYHVIGGSVSNGTFVSGVVSLAASEGSTLLERKVGQGGFAHTESDFRGLNVVAGVPVARAVVMGGATLPETVASSLYGWFGNFVDPISRLTVDGPDGSSTAPMHLFGGNAAGAYDFIVDADVGLPNGHLWLWGLDVETV